jgi:hypothetical protein
MALAGVFVLVCGIAFYAMSFLRPVGIFVLFAIVLSLWLWLAPKQRQRRRWEAMGNCPICGYDLRASYETCPECGGPIFEDLARRRRIRTYLAEKKNKPSAPTGAKSCSVEETPHDRKHQE